MKAEKGKTSIRNGLRRVNPGESRGILGDASESGFSQSPHSHTHSQSQTHSQSNPAAPGSAEAASPPSAAPAPPTKTKAMAAPATPNDGLLCFPTVGGKNSRAQCWWLLKPKVEELREAFPAVDVISESRIALQWVRSKPAHRKTAGGMEEFLFRWMKRCQDKGGSSGRGSREDSRQAQVDQALDELKLEPTP